MNKLWTVQAYINNLRGHKGNTENNEKSLQRITLKLSLMLSDIPIHKAIEHFHHEWLELLSSFQKRDSYIRPSQLPSLTQGYGIGRNFCKGKESERETKWNGGLSWQRIFEANNWDDAEILVGLC